MKNIYIKLVLWSGMENLDIVKVLVSETQKYIEYDDLIANEYLRSLNEDEIRQLCTSGNKSVDWTIVFVRKSFDSNSLSFIRNCTFIGWCIIGNCLTEVSDTLGLLFPSTLQNTRFENCVIGDNCYISNTTAVKNVYISHNTSIIDCGYILSDKSTSFSNGQNVAIGPETGGRKIPVHVGLTYREICHVALKRSDESYQASCQLNANLIKESLTIQMCIIGEHVKLYRCNMIRNSLISGYIS
eukprot:gene14991-31831_t